MKKNMEDEENKRLDQRKEKKKFLERQKKVK